MVKRKHRSGALNLLSDFIQSQPPHLYQVFQTPLFDTLIRCLQNDTSTTIVSLALTSLVMLLPNVPTSLVSYLPTLFNVYARLLFWDRERSIETNGPQAVGPEGLSGNSTWEKCVYSPDVDDGGIPHLLGYFTILYGLYPINFMDYIRKPQRYLRHANAPNPDDIEVQPYEIRHRSERYRQWHLLHRNFYDLTLESEKTDFSRWIRSEPADVLADCIALCLAETDPSYPIETASGTRAVNPAAVDTTEGDAVDTSLLSGSMVLPTPESRPSRPASGGSPSSSRAPSALMRRSSQSSHPSTRNSVDARTREAGFDSPTLPPHLVVSPSQTDLQDMINSNKVIKSGLHQSLANDSVPSLSLSHHDPVSERVPSRAPAPYPSAYALSPAPDEASEQVARLRRQILLLKNDLSFERYLKQQHMNHIGTLRRRQVKEAATEAETQNLLMANRNLKQRLEDARKAETQVRKESEKSRALSNKWEADLSTKLRALREEQKKWMVEGTALKRALGETREENEKLRKMVCDAEVRQLSSQHTLQSIESRGQEMEWLKAEVARLEKADGDKQARVRELEAAQHDATEAGGQAEALRMEMTARASDMQRMKAAYETQIVVVNAKLAEALRSKRATDVEVQPMVESALAASRAKQLELQKQLSLLTRKYTVLQSSLLDLTSNSHLTRARTDPAASSDADAEVSAILGTPRSRTQRVFAEPDAGEGSSYHATPPLDGFGLGTSAGTVIHRPSTPTSSSRTDPGAASSTSPERERYFGRGERYFPPHSPVDESESDTLYRGRAKRGSERPQGQEARAGEEGQKVDGHPRHQRLCMIAARGCACATGRVPRRGRDGSAHCSGCCRWTKVFAAQGPPGGRPRQIRRA